MKVKINRNILWTETFAKELAAIGVKYACISPGSRNTPLTLAFAGNKNIKSYVHIDERSCGFFALGLAKSSNTPVVIVCTSGTAAAELYPAIIEAYQQRVPLIVCTADRPPELLDVGANQTINQNNLYKNHIRWFVDAGVPEPIIRRIKHIKVVARRAILESCIRSKGPVHINFPFRKPFEPDSYTDEVSKEVINLADEILTDKEQLFKEEEKDISDEKWFLEVYNYLKIYKKGLIVAGPENYNEKFSENCRSLSDILNYPVLADGASQLRFGKNDKKNILTNFEGFLRSESFCRKYQPEIVLQFGRTITSKALDAYLEKCSALRFMINDYGDWFDPSNKSIASFPCKPYKFCQRMNEMFERDGMKKNDLGWKNIFSKADNLSRKIKEEIIDKAKFPNESRIIKEILDAIPDNSQIMVSNSSPIRDFDYFASNSDKNIKIFYNRGASGIDGITSTTLGIAEESKKPTILITGDLAFYYDLNGLLAAYKYSIPLIIILINNNGGGIFEVLPISKYGKIFKEFFITPHNLNFNGFVKGYGGSHKLIKSWNDFNTSFKSSFKRKNFTVLEIKTDAVKSLKLREKFWEETNKNLMKFKMI